MSSRGLRWMTLIPCGSMLLMVAACGGTTPVASHGNTIKDHVSFVDALRAKGLTVDSVGSVEQPFLQPEGTALRVSGGNLKEPAEFQSFNYDDGDLGTDGLKAAAEDASQIEPNGSPRTARINWIAPPHFFRKERVIVIYLGSDANALALLTELLGPQFAGR